FSASFSTPFWPVLALRHHIQLGGAERTLVPMSPVPVLRFISLFVPSLAEAVPRYQALLGVPPSDGSDAAPKHHPFAAQGPVVFRLGEVALALYECDGRTTHPGDVGFGLETPVGAAAVRIREQGGRVFWGPRAVDGREQRMAVGMLPDRHFFEIVEATAASGE
ncbi:MAG: hypothetical protein JW751_25025, partial [Polyangiaceae bacterium]|nr:hypothetical protein [Polyangiaceae bacterium]